MPGGRGYPVGMDDLPLPAPRSLTVLLTPDPGGDVLARFIAGLALRGPLTVLDGGNCFPGYRLLQYLRLQVPDPGPAARRIVVRRAFTCHQVLSLLEGTPSLPEPHILLDPLATFQDEQIPLAEAGRLWDGCLRQVERLQALAPVLAALAPPSRPERADFLERLLARADRLYAPALPDPHPLQPALL